MPHRSLQLFAVLTAGALAPATALANSSGKTGQSTAGCGSCHGSSSTDTTVTFSSPVTEVDAGDTITVTFTVENSGQSSYGMNVSATSGTFTAGTGTQVSGGEVTHDGAQSSDEFTFDWTAPSTAGTATFSGAGNAVNDNGGNSGDEWNLATDLDITVCVDSDGDLVTDCDGDCDDGDSAVFPGATETCNDIDDNCDGDIDEGLATNDYYTDGDLDGFGAGSVSLEDCDTTAPTGFSATDDDCDDGDNSIYPGAPETCDGEDEDCDTVIDNDVVTSTYYEDSDGDGYGDPDGATIEDCVEPTGYADNTDDCDDDEGDTYPGATDDWYDGVDSDCAEDDDYDADLDGYQSMEETDDGLDCDDSDPDINPDGEDIEDDGIDQDCDGEDATAGGDDGGGDDGGDDGGGDDGGEVEDLDGDGVSEADGDCDDTSAAIYPGAPEAPNDGIDQDCDGEDTVVEPIDTISEADFADKGGCATAASAPLSAGFLAGILGLLFVRRRES